MNAILRYCNIGISFSAIFLSPSENVQLSTVLHPHMGHLNKLLTSIVQYILREGNNTYIALVSAGHLKKVLNWIECTYDYVTSWQENKRVGTVEESHLNTSSRSKLTNLPGIGWVWCFNKTSSLWFLSRVSDMNKIWSCDPFRIVSTVHRDWWTKICLFVT